MKLFYAWLIFALGAVLSVWYTYFFAIEFSAFAFAWAAAAEGITLVIIIDKFFFPQIDTIEEIKNGNRAVAMLYIAIAIVVAGAFLGAR